ncbi:MAG: DUF2236 domain-containing protein [Acidimicrobiales bacterium]|nr:DUF2236 domain-containing protein [Acidimicrobiales bacterium]
MDALDVIERIDRSGVTRGLGDRGFSDIREKFFKGVQFSDPPGDPGWFGPDSPVWYVHSHVPLVQVALAAAAMMETLHPDMAWMAYEHTRVLERIDGVPTGHHDRDAMASRAGHSFAFFLGTTMAATPVAERLARVVNAMHDRVHGVRPDGRSYRANDPELLRWNYATIVWALAASHERYHPRPLRGAELDAFYREYTRVGHALGATDLPDSKAGIAEYLEDSLPLLGVTMPTVRLLNPLAPWRHPKSVRPVISLVHWAVQDLQPSWAQELLNVRQLSRPQKAAKRAATKALLTAARGAGQVREIEQAYERAAPTTGSVGHGTGEPTGRDRLPASLTHQVTTP